MRKFSKKFTSVRAYLDLSDPKASRVDPDHQETWVAEVNLDHQDQKGSRDILEPLGTQETKDPRE